MTALWWVALTTPLACLAADKTRVQVNLSIEQPVLRQFAAADRKWLETEGAKVIARKLASKASFLAFDTQPNADYQLVFILDDLDRSHAGISDIVYHASLVGGSPETLAQGQWRFRTSAEYLSKERGTREQFFNELQSTVAQASVAALLAQLLSQIPITRQALTWGQPRGLAISHKTPDLCVGSRSRFRVELQVDDHGVSLPTTFKALPGNFNPSIPAPPALFRGGIFLNPLPPDPHGMDRIRWSSMTTVDAEVFVEEYNQLVAGCRIGPASGEGEGQ